MIRMFIALLALLAVLGCAPSTIDSKPVDQPDGGIGGTGVSDKM